MTWVDLNNCTVTLYLHFQTSSIPFLPPSHPSFYFLLSLCSPLFLSLTVILLLFIGYSLIDSSSTSFPLPSSSFPVWFSTPTIFYRSIFAPSLQNTKRVHFCTNHPQHLFMPVWTWVKKLTGIRASTRVSFSAFGTIYDSTGAKHRMVHGTKEKSGVGGVNPASRDSPQVGYQWGYGHMVLEPMGGHGAAAGLWKS